MNISEIAKKLVIDGKGILAADESEGTIVKRFVPYNIASTPQTHQIYRQLLFTTPEIEKYISGVILFDETIRQKMSTGILFSDYLQSRGILSGIKVDEGTVAFSQFEKVTQGLVGLDQRLSEYEKYGVAFTKWRGVFTIGEGLPTKACIEENALRLAKFALLSQQHNLVPIVEPEVLMDGSHSLKECENVTTEVLTYVFEELQKNKINLNGMLLKPNMILPGKDSIEQVTRDQIADATIRTIKKVVPTEVAGIVFLSGGQTPDAATETLQTINQQNDTGFAMSFSFGRALQQEALSAWQGKSENNLVAQKVFLERCKKVSKATVSNITH